MTKHLFSLILLVLILLSACSCSWYNKPVTVTDKPDTEVFVVQSETAHDSRPVAIICKKDVEAIIRLIEDFDKEWTNYVNKREEKVFGFIKKDSKLFSIVKNFSNKDCTEDILDVKVRGINFENGKVYVKVYEEVRKDFYESDYSFVKYDWVFEAEKIGINKWILADRVKNKEVMTRSYYDMTVINDKEFLADNWVYFSNPEDGNKLYKADFTSDTIVKINDEPSAIIDLFDNYIYYIGKSILDKPKTYDICKIHIETGKKANIRPIFKENGYRYFYDFISIYKVNDIDMTFEKIFSRDVSGAMMKISKVKDGWIYFGITSEDGQAKYRIKTDGTQEEEL